MNFNQIIEIVKERQDKKRIVIAGAGEKELLTAASKACSAGIADFTYIGDYSSIMRIVRDNELYIPQTTRLISKSDVVAAGKKAIQLIESDASQILMKGHIGSRDLLSMVLHSEALKQRRKNRFLSHIAIFEWKEQLKLFTDGGLNIAPSLEEKRKITSNAIEIAHKLGIKTPRIAFLSGAEKVNPKMPSSVEAAELAQMDWGNAIAGGPLAFDGAISERAYRIKGIPSPVEGKADILIAPNVETANAACKAMIELGVNMAGCIVGAGVPLILLSRSDREYLRFLSIATTVYLSS